MNVMDLMKDYFGGAAAEHLGRAAGLDAQTAQKALGLGLPMQLDALADHAGTTQGQAQIADAIQNLPQFGSVQDALSSAGGADNLQRAGELLAPALLGGQQDRIMSAMTGQIGGAPAGGVQKLMQMALPLMLSFLAQRGLSGSNIGSMLPGMKGGLGSLLGAGAAALGANALGGAAGGLNAASLIDLLKGQFGGAAGERIGTAAGFGGSAAGRAAMAALPLLLNGIANKGRTESGAHDVMSLAQGFSGLTDASGNLNLNFLNDNAETTRIEGQGRGLLGSLFGNVDEVTGRLGSALGGSGSNAGRLLSLMAPMVLSLLGNRAKAANMNASGFSGLLGGLGSHLTGLLPAGLTGLGALLGGNAAASTVSTGTVPVTTGKVTTTPVTPATPAPRPAATTTTTHTATAPVTTEKRGGFPWWLIPLALLLLLGGCWLTRPKDTVSTTTTSTTTTDTTSTGTTDTTDTTTTDTTTTPVSDGTFTITEPAADATLASGGFTMKGTGKPGDTVQLFEDGTSLGNVTVGDDGNWSFDVPSPAAGAHTYAAKGADGTELGTVAATIGEPEANASGATCDKDYTLSITDGQTVTEPFRFGGVGQGEGYSVTVKRGERTIGTKDIRLDASCGWSYNSKPGKGEVTYEVRPMGDATAEPLSVVNLTVTQ